MNTPPGCRTLTDYLDHWASSRPDQVAIVSKDIRLTYAEFARRVDQCSRALVAHGVERGERIAVLSTPRWEFVVIYLAATKIGAVFVGLNPKHQSEELKYVITDSNPSLIFSIESFEGRDYASDIQVLVDTSETIRETIIIDRESYDGLDFLKFLQSDNASLDREIQTRLSTSRDRDGLCLVYTSGSTGRPKGALLPRDGLTIQHEYLAYSLDVEPFVAQSDHPIDHVGGLDRVYLSLILGGKLILHERFKPEWVLSAIESESVTFWLGELTQFIRCESHLDDYNLSSVQLALFIGAPSIKLLKRLSSQIQCLSTGYGMTELSNICHFTSRRTSFSEFANHNVGHPFPSVITRICDGDGKDSKLGEPGQLCIRSSSLFLGYWDRQEATRASFSEDGWFQTGDIVSEQPDGSIRFLGRAGNTFKSGGYNIYPEEIEKCLEANPKVAEAIVTSVKHTIYQRVGVAFLTSRDNDISVSEIEEYCRQHLANYKCPKRFIILSSLPHLPNGKVDRVTLQVRAEEVALE